MFWWTDRYLAGPVPNFSQLGSASYYMLRGLEQLIMFSVPAFLFVSGFFVAVATGRQGTIRWNVVLNRVKFLFVPYLMWSVLIFIWDGMQGRVDSAAGYLQKLLFGGTAPPFFYIPLVIQLYLLSPAIVPLMRKCPKLVLLSAGLLQLTLRLAEYPVLLGWNAPAANWIVRHAPGWFIPQAVFWFVLGIFAGFHLSRMKLWLARARWPLLAATVLFFGLAFVEWEMLFRVSGKPWLPPGITLLDNLYSGALILTFIAFERSRMPFAGALQDLGTRSFGIYLIHAPVLEVVARTAYHAAPSLLGMPPVFQAILILSALAVPTALMRMINRSPARPCYQYLFG
jgi:membrane-bound acyltransferase YfiQ involved in biofilm formation